MKHINDIATIASALNGKIEFSSINFDQCILSEEWREKSVNNIVFVKKAYGIYFYTKKTALDDVMALKATTVPTLVGCAGSNCLYEIKK